MSARAATRAPTAGAMLGILLGVLAVGSAAAQSPPDLTGAWERYRAPAGDPSAPPPEGSPPLKAPLLKEWEARRAAEREADARGEPIAKGYTHCIPEGYPTMMGGPFPLEIVQSRSQINIAQEAYSQVRRIYLGKPQKKLEDVEPGFYGHSVGNWEGNTLVVDTIGIKDYVVYRDVPHSPQLRVRERLHLVTPDILWDELTFEDPAVLEKPWKVTFAYRRAPNYEIIEYVCEDNREYADDKGVTRLRLKGQ
jgi:hypothetical protein